MLIERTVTVDRPQAEVFAYLADFTTTTQWDPGTLRTTRESGDGGIGTTYRNVSRFLGRETRLTYVVTDYQSPQLLQLRGENRTVLARDTMRLTGTGGATMISYRAEFEFKGWARLVAPLAAPALRRLGDRAAQGLRSALDGPAQS
jgi:carbon monoxide dehydrogenase subunit G